MENNKKYFLYMVFFVFLLKPETTSALGHFFADPTIQMVEPTEHGYYQGYELRYQYFESTSSIKELVQRWQKKLDVALQIQKIPHLWLISFEQADQHVLIQLQAISDTKTVGWWSSLALSQQKADQAPEVIKQAASQWWMFQSKFELHTYFMFRAKFLPHQLQQIVRRRNWRPAYAFCSELHACLWQKGQQRMRWWFDSESNFWHAQFWHVKQNFTGDAP